METEALGENTGIGMHQVDLFNETEMTHKHDPGGKVRLALPDGTVGAAVFGGKRQEYRYRLSRTWDAERPHVLFVMMNPSTADPLVDDPTVAKCGRFARAWRYGGLHVGNTFAYRTTDQKRLMQVDYAPDFLLYNHSLNPWGRERQLPEPAKQTFREWYLANRSEHGND